MYFEKWDEIAFGSDDAMNFVDFIEMLPYDTLRLKNIFEYSDLDQHLNSENYIKENNTVRFEINEFVINPLYEQALITLSAIIAECILNGSANLDNVFTGEKTLKFDIVRSELSLVINAVKHLVEHTEKYEIYELVDSYEEEFIEIITDILKTLEICVGKVEDK